MASVTKPGAGRRHIVVIGGGFAGAAAAAHLARVGRAARVTLVSSDRRVGAGLAYGQAGGANLLNVRAAQMSALDDDPAHFVRWLQAREGGAQADRYAPRGLYGDYAAATFRACAKAGWLGSTRVVRGRAAACRREGEGWAVMLASGRVICGDAIVLALGHPPVGAPSPFGAGDLIGAWDRRAQARLPARGDVLLLGTGLTMADVALALADDKAPKGVIYALSRRGRLPEAHAASSPAPLDMGEIPLELSAALHAFRARAGADWRAGLNGLRAATPDLWARLGRERQERFLRHLRPWWDSHRHRAAPHVIARLNALIAAGRLRILAGEISDAIRENGVWRLQHRPRGGFARQRLDVAGIINCTGPDHALSRWDDALIRQLLDEGLARAPANGLGLDVDAENRLRDKAGLSHRDIFVLGPLAIGAFWESTAVPEIRARAAAIARALV